LTQRGADKSDPFFENPEQETSTRPRSVLRVRKNQAGVTPLIYEMDGAAKSGRAGVGR
jgi:hypothetical protein